MKLIPIQSEDARWHCRRRRKPSRTAALLCHRQGTNRGASGKGALVSGGCCTAAKMKGTQHPARKWPVRMWCWFWKCELYVSLGGGGLLGLCLAVTGRIRCLPRRAGSCPLSEAAAGGAHPRDSPDTKQTSRRAPQGSGSSPSFSASAQAKPHSSSFALQTHTSSSRLVKKMHLAADRYLSFLPAALYGTLHNFLREK